MVNITVASHKLILTQCNHTNKIFFSILFSVVCVEKTLTAFNEKTTDVVHDNLYKCQTKNTIFLNHYSKSIYSVEMSTVTLSNFNDFTDVLCGVFSFVMVCPPPFLDIAVYENCFGKHFFLGKSFQIPYILNPLMQFNIHVHLACSSLRLLARSSRIILKV